MPDEVSLDLTKARTFQTLPAGGPYLMACSAMELGTSQSSGAKKVTITWNVVAPEEYNTQRMREDISLEEEWNLGRLMSRLIAMGDSEEFVKTANFKFNPDNYVGRRLTAFTRVRPAQGNWPERAEIARVSPEGTYEEAGA